MLLPDVWSYGYAGMVRENACVRLRRVGERWGSKRSPAVFSSESRHFPPMEMPLSDGGNMGNCNSGKRRRFVNMLIYNYFYFPSPDERKNYAFFAKNA